MTALGTIRKNSREEIRVSLDEFRGMTLVSLRVWFQADDGNMRPGRQGARIPSRGTGRGAGRASPRRCGIDRRRQRMTPDQIERILATIKESAEEHPMVFLELLARRALHENGAEAIPQLAQACEDMGRWYQAQADALEAEGRKRGNNVTPFPTDGEGRA